MDGITAVVGRPAWGLVRFRSGSVGRRETVCHAMSTARNHRAMRFARRAESISWTTWIRSARAISIRSDAGSDIKAIISRFDDRDGGTRPTVCRRGRCVPRLQLLASHRRRGPGSVPVRARSPDGSCAAACRRWDDWPSFPSTAAARSCPVSSVDARTRPAAAPVQRSAPAPLPTVQPAAAAIG
jgi:hypothetical protein